MPLTEVLVLRNSCVKFRMQSGRALVCSFFPISESSGFCTLFRLQLLSPYTFPSNGEGRGAKLCFFSLLITPTGHEPAIQTKQCAIPATALLITLEEQTKNKKGREAPGCCVWCPPPPGPPEHSHSPVRPKPQNSLKSPSILLMYSLWHKTCLNHD